MEPQVGETQLQFRSGIRGSNPEEMGFGFLQAHDVISTQTQSETGGSSFTALLELPPPQAVELLVNEDFQAKTPPPIFPSNTALIDRASKFSVFATVCNSPEGNCVVSGSRSMKPDVVKQEPLESDSHLNSSKPATSNQSPKSLKRKEKERKVNETNKKSKKVAPNDISDGSGDKLPYIHVRARRGQATDSHSLAERARREKINARMKLLQELVPGCNKISGTAMVLDEIINHVQALQRQVEFLSMRLAAVNPRSDINLDAFLAEESEPAVNNYQSMFPASMCPEGQISGSRQQYQQLWHFEGLQQPIWGREEDNSNFITTENPLLSFDSSSNSGIRTGVKESEWVRMEGMRCNRRKGSTILIKPVISLLAYEQDAIFLFSTCATHNTDFPVCGALPAAAVASVYLVFPSYSEKHIMDED